MWTFHCNNGLFQCQSYACVYLSISSSEYSITSINLPVNPCQSISAKRFGIFSFCWSGQHPMRAELRVSSECICEASLLWSLWFAEMACVRWAKQTWVSSSSPVQIRQSRTNGKALMKSCRLWMDRCHCQHQSVLLLCPVPPLSSLLQWGIVAMEALFDSKETNHLR